MVLVNSNRMRIATQSVAAVRSHAERGNEV